MIGIQTGLIAAEGERKRRVQFADRNPGLITRPGLGRSRPASTFTVTVFTRKQTAAQGFHQMPSYQPATSHEPAANLTATVTDYGEAGKLVVPAGTMIDCIEIKVKAGMPIHPDFILATGGQEDMRRHKSLNYYKSSGRSYHTEMARWYYPTTTDAADITTATGGNRFANSWTLTRRWGNRYVITQPVCTLVKGSSVFDGQTYRIWDAYRGLTGWNRQGASDFYYSRRVGNRSQLQYWADDQYETDFLRQRTLPSDIRGSSYSGATWYQYSHPRMVGSHFLTTAYNTASPRIVNFDLSPIEAGKRFVIQQEFE
jgi:hypothetical protein